MARQTAITLKSVVQYCRHRVRALTNIFTVGSLAAQRIMQQFRAAGAVTPDRARPFHPQTRIEQIEFLRLLRAQVIREPSPGRYFLDDRRLTRALKDAERPSR